MNSIPLDKNFSSEDIFHIGVKALIYNQDNKVLVLYAKKNNITYWDFPGGRIQIGETPEQTALREIYEETGIAQLNNMRYLGMAFSPIRINLANGQDVGLILSFYTATINSETVSDKHITLSTEHDEYKWITLQEAISLLECDYGPSFITCLNNLNRQ